MSRTTKEALDTAHNKVSYGIGRQMGAQLRGNDFKGIDIELVMAGLGDSYEGLEDLVGVEEMSKAYTEIQAQIQQEVAAEAQANLKQGEEFLAENKAKDGINTTESGLQYEVLVEGKGDIPEASSRVKTHYHGTFIDGRVFDSSVERGEPATFPVNGVIRGWTEALTMMPVGSKWKLYVPSDLAYGSQGASGSIPPNTTLIFEVELIEIV
ncbi:FKBP-type peptidyl-prolyl cis-trans isomerase [Litoribrevibacter albus]|uniref:Peptidyl-prolyl cis-trans isomerase n=1 Tax=Litoribrevibacter albus TaxID=1473156 RepID=A0AA37S9N3_9GAMM|nr:FKBP-type peptidyl-prolyl cis-trans isomerase [Litoribrevibacter albus]GLQ31800.1 peptidyl-prolyl cis-trans isomerase [Litoribrevibacter albus]